MSTLSAVIVRFFGRVKWFNNKAGYGFITVIDGSTAGSELFIHHSSIKTATEQYKYLVQGEYVEFTLSTVATGAHESQAVDVTGIRSGLLMCETRALAMEYSQNQDEIQATAQVPAATTKPKSKYIKNAHPSADLGGEWTPASKRPPRENQSQGRGRGQGQGRGSGPQGRGRGRGSGPK
jgi:cold shock CspA family protein